MAEHLVTLLVRHDETSDPQGWDWSAKLGCREVSVIASAALPPLLELDPLAVPEQLLRAPAPQESAEEPELALDEAVEDDGFGTLDMDALSVDEEESPSEEAISLETPGFGEEELDLALQSLEQNSYGNETADEFSSSLALEEDESDLSEIGFGSFDADADESAADDTGATLAPEDMEMGFETFGGAEAEPESEALELSGFETSPELESDALALTSHEEVPAESAEATPVYGESSYGADEDEFSGLELMGADLSSEEPVELEAGQELDADTGVEDVAFEDVAFEEMVFEEEALDETVFAPAAEETEPGPLALEAGAGDEYGFGTTEQSTWEPEAVEPASAELYGESELDLGDLDLDEAPAESAAVSDELHLDDLDLDEAPQSAPLESEATGFEDMDELDSGMAWGQLSDDSEATESSVAEDTPIESMNEDDRRAAAYQLFEGLWTQVCAAAQPHHFILLSHFSELTPPEMLHRLSSTLDPEGRVPTPIEQSEARAIAERIRRLDPETYPYV